MAKNILFLGVLIWAAQSMAAPVVVHEPKLDHENYKVEKPVPEKEGRSLAGLKKKEKPEAKTETEESMDSEVRYWEYQE